MVIQINPKVQNSYYFRGKANQKLGNIKKTCEDWSKSGELGNQEAYELIRKYCK